MSALSRIGVAATFLTAVPIGLVMISGETAAYVTVVGVYKACVPSSEPVGDLDPQQAKNARLIVREGQRLQIPEFGLVVALAAARQESRLLALDYGHLDSLGLFQQRAPWGSVAERLDPATSARMFYSGGSVEPDGWEEPGLLDIDGWQAMTLTRAAQAVQQSAYPDAYAKWEDDAVAWLADILGQEATRSPLPRWVDDPGGSDTAIIGCRADGSSIVGDLAGLRARAAAFVDASAAGQPDPFYGELSYYRRCGSLAARIHGHEASGFATAITQWQSYVQRGLAHVGDQQPPPGALVFWDTPTAGHVAVYLGRGEVVTNDLYDGATGIHGGVYFAPMDDITSGTWHLPYLGWAPPVYRDGLDGGRPGSPLP